MKKKIALVLAVAAMGTMGLVSCGGGESSQQPSISSREVVYVDDIQLDSTDLAVNINETVKITATVLPANVSSRGVTYSSANPEIASVSNSGVGTGKAAGETTITVTCGFIYGFAVGSALGILDESEYLTRADDAYQTVIEECFIDDTDQLGYMQTVGYQPQNYVSEEFTRPITDEFGIGLFLLASSALLRMTPQYEPMPITVTASRQGYYFA